MTAWKDKHYLKVKYTSRYVWVNHYNAIFNWRNIMWYGKGSRARPLSVSKETFNDNWDKIFSKKDTNKTKDLSEHDLNDLATQIINVVSTEEVISNSHGSHAFK